jgi:hypothetical protein
MTTSYLIGVDEAGYGPNLGPLVVAATVWEVVEPEDDRAAAANGHGQRPRDLARTNWYSRLADRISLTADANRVAVADSKTLYSPAAGVGLLEEGVLAALAACGESPTSWNRLLDLLGADSNGDGTALPWHESWDTLLPVSACSLRVQQLAARLRQDPAIARRSRKRPQAKLCGIYACLVHPGTFNRRTAESGNKATALSRISLQLLGRVFESLPAAANDGRLAAIAVCDKHGGRDHYAPLLMEAFCDSLLQVEQESRAVSRYRARIGCTDADVSFKRNGETFLPTALASMTAKYVRELAMRAFNEFWCGHVADLRPTAGYPVDSYRFKRDIAAAQAELGIDDHLLWRSR